MSRLLVHVEGETEETFVNEILAPHLYNKGFTRVSARLVGNSRQRDRRGGIKAWTSVRKDIIKHLLEDSSSLTTTMVDYYALPGDGDRGWPGRKEARALPFAQKATKVEDALLKDISIELGAGFDTRRFIPFVIMHEFEGLLFSDCGGFSRAIGRSDLNDEFQAIRDQFSSPEEINDSPTTAPSKRIGNLVKGYEKPLLGTLAALEIGLNKIRAECPHFCVWLTRLETLPNEYSI